MTEIFYLLVAVSIFLAVANWRTGIYLVVLMDLLRDPVRKLDPSESVWITVSVNLIWGGIALGVINERQRDIREILNAYPRIRTFLICFCTALVPGSILSLLVPGGWKLVLVGLASYLGPLLGILIGFSLGRTSNTLMNFLKVYAIANAVFLVGALFEYWNYDWDVLGGLQGMVWIRYHEDEVLDLIGGFYRSPDILGIHAAHVVVFSMILGLRSRGLGRLGWGGIAIWASVCLLLSGRRKSIGIPLMFVAALLAAGLYYGFLRARKLVSFGIALAVIGAGFMLATQESDIGSEYSDFAATIVTQGAERINQIFAGSAVGTVVQSGILGSGIGSATQGARYTQVQRTKAWQEDGVSRLFKELGVPGVVLMLIAFVNFMLVLQSSFQKMKRIPRIQLLHGCLFAVVVGNMFSFMVSHQQYSGDPCSALFVVLLFGAMLSLPVPIFVMRPPAVQVPQPAPQGGVSRK